MTPYGRAASEGGYKQLFENMLDGFALHEILMGPDGIPRDYRFPAVNPAFEQLTGLVASEVIGKTVRGVLPGRETEWIKGLGAVARGGRPVRITHKRGDLDRVFEVRAYSPAPLHFACLFRDVTACRAAEEKYRLNEARLESLVRIAQHRAETAPELLEFALNEAIALTSSTIGSLSLYDEMREELSWTTWSKGAMARCPIADPGRVHALAGNGLWAEAIRRRQPVIVNDYPAYAADGMGCPPGHVELSRFMSVPVFSGRSIVAVIGVANKAGPYDRADARQLELLMDAAWKTVEIKRAEDRNRFQARLLHMFRHAVIAADAEGRVTFWNRAAEELWGWSARDADFTSCRGRPGAISTGAARSSAAPAAGCPESPAARARCPRARR